jgi:hypothetical protein
MRRVLGVAVVALLAGVTLGAVTYAFVVDADYELPASPCGASVTVQATPLLFDGKLWVSYLCADSRVYMRGFHTAVGTNLPPQAIVCPQGFVHTGNKQGCVPPDHPSAGR